MAEKVADNNHVSGEVTQRQYPKIWQYSFVNLRTIKKHVLAFAAKAKEVPWYKILDMWCGNKPYLSFFSGYSEYVGTDIIPWPLVDVICDNDAIPLPDSSFDFMLSNQTLEHTKNVHWAIGEIKRIVKKDWLILVSIPFLYPEHACPWDFYRFTRFGLQEIFKDFEIVSIDSSSWYFTSVWFYVNMLFTHGALMRKIFSPLFLVMNSVWLFLERILVWFFYEMLNMKKIWIMRTIVENHYKQFTLDYIIVLKNSQK